MSKQLLPVYNKPLIYYPLSTLMAAGVREVLVITTPDDAQAFRRLLDDGSAWGMTIEYATQKSPDGLAQAFLIGEDFLAGDSVALMLGDNILHGPGLGRHLATCTSPTGGHIFAYQVADPSNYGVVEFDGDGRVISIEEKPQDPRSRFAVPGLYFYSSDVVEIARQVVPSARGELEIAAVNRAYLARERLELTVLSRGTTWMDAGTPQSLLEAGELISVLEQRQGVGVGYPEEIAWRNAWITTGDLIKAADGYGDSPYAAYLRRLVDSNPDGRA